MAYPPRRTEYRTLSVSDGAVSADRHKIIEGGYITQVAISADGGYLYLISGYPEQLIVFPVSMLDVVSEEPMINLTNR